jgi:hypothetical protein
MTDVVATARAAHPTLGIDDAAFPGVRRRALSRRPGARGGTSASTPATCISRTRASPTRRVPTRCSCSSWSRVARRGLAARRPARPRRRPRAPVPEGALSRRVQADLPRCVRGARRSRSRPARPVPRRWPHDRSARRPPRHRVTGSRWVLKAQDELRNHVVEALRSRLRLSATSLARVTYLGPQPAHGQPRATRRLSDARSRGGAAAALVEQVEPDTVDRCHFAGLRITSCASLL